MKKLTICAAALWAAFSGPAAAEGPVVVELFTSQGCSSCPPADKVFSQIVDRDDVIAIALHVDYWDYLGWKDEFADPSFTARQRAYARAAKSRTVYTPQMIVGGRDHIVGTRPMELADLVQKHKSSPNPVKVTLKRDGDRVRIAASGNVGAGAVVHILTYTPKATVSIRRGENAGRKLDYHNTVNKMIEVAKWNGSSDYRASVKMPNGAPVVVLVQQKGAGPILGAARLR
ncbi:MAG: DUF1223 domain-containing protein [Paracoccaceae bacterium]